MQSASLGKNFAVVNKLCSSGGNTVVCLCMNTIRKMCVHVRLCLLIYNLALSYVCLILNSRYSMTKHNFYIAWHSADMQFTSYSHYTSKSFNVQPYGECNQNNAGFGRYNNETNCKQNGGEWKLLYSYLEKAKGNEFGIRLLIIVIYQITYMQATGH